MLIQTWRFPFVEHKIRCFAEFAKHYFLHTVQAVGTEAVCVRKKLKFESLLAENLPHICVSFIFKYVASRCVFSLTDKSGRTFCIASFVFRGWKKNTRVWNEKWCIFDFWSFIPIICVYVAHGHLHPLRGTIPDFYIMCHVTKHLYPLPRM